MISIVIGLTVSFAVQALVTPGETLQHFIAYLVSIITVSVQGFAWVTIAFVIIEKAGVKPGKLGHNKREWSLADLPEIPERRLLIKRSDL
ncbi:hypothetical protein D3C77_483080 [compost metagenome]